ncbi:MAG TPA: hypothetical protein DD381_11465, partial [Lentisphaeria bacterium]|nr:hypothetical protein [Lentisphaeria bacterium]
MLRSTLIFLFAITLIPFFFVLNFRTAVFSADKIRELATESNLYQTVSSIFISEVAKGVKDVEKKDEIIEKLDAAFSPIVL